MNLFGSSCGNTDSNVLWCFLLLVCMLCNSCGTNCNSVAGTSTSPCYNTAGTTTGSCSNNNLFFLPLLLLILCSCGTNSSNTCGC